MSRGSVDPRKSAPLVGGLRPEPGHGALPVRQLYGAGHGGAVVRAGPRRRDLARGGGSGLLWRYRAGDQAPLAADGSIPWAPGGWPSLAARSSAYRPYSIFSHSTYGSSYRCACCRASASRWRQWPPAPSSPTCPRFRSGPGRCLTWATP